MEETEVEYQGLELTVQYEYTPAEKEVLYDNDGAGCSGSSASVDVWGVFLGEHLITALLSEDAVEDIECLILEKHGK